MDRIYQLRVYDWMIECFGPEISADKVERADRFVEEALELAQATGWTKDRAHALVDYVFGRPVGEITQEAGGVAVTLAALCNTFGVSIEGAAKAELDRITTPEMVDKIRAKQATKPVGSALPVAREWAPVLEYHWYYADSEDAEYYPGKCDSRDEAFEEAKDHYADDAEPNAETGRTELSVVLIEGAKEPLRLASYISIDDMVERADEAVMEGEQVTEDDEPPFFGETIAALGSDLERRIKRACDEWQIANEFFPTTRCVSAVRSFETVTVDVTEDHEAAKAFKSEDGEALVSR